MAEQENSRGHGLLGGLELAGLQELSLSKQEFVPIESRTKIGRVIAHRLVQAGLAEVGPCSDAFTA